MIFDYLVVYVIFKLLVIYIYMVDLLVYVFGGCLYIYLLYDIDGGVLFDDEGGYFGMEDYYVFWMDMFDGEVMDCGMVLYLCDVFWVVKQMWVLDVVICDGCYYLYFLVKDGQGMFCIGVVVVDCLEGFFKVEFELMVGIYLIDLVVFEDDDGVYYFYFGGIWGG